MLLIHIIFHFHSAQLHILHRDRIPCFLQNFNCPFELREYIKACVKIIVSGSARHHGINRFCRWYSGILNVQACTWLSGQHFRIRLLYILTKCIHQQLSLCLIVLEKGNRFSCNKITAHLIHIFIIQLQNGIALRL